MTLFLTTNNNSINLASTLSDGNVPVDGSTTVLDGVTIVANMNLYLQYNTSASERAVYNTGANPATPWTKIAGTQINQLSSNKTLQMFITQGTQYGGTIQTITDFTTGLFVSSTTVTPFGTTSNGGYQNSLGIYKYIDSASTPINAGNKEDIVFTFLTGGGSVPFTDISKMRIESVSLLTSDAGTQFMAQVSPITLVTEATISVSNIGSSNGSVVARINVSQI